MELENTQFLDVLSLIRQKIIQIDFDHSELKLQEIEQNRTKIENRIKKLLEELEYDDRAEWIYYHRMQGSKFVKNQNYQTALWEYYLSLLAINDTKILREFGADIINNIQIILEVFKKPLTQELLEFVLYLDGSNFKAEYKLGKFYLNQNDKKKALEHFKQGLAKCNNDKELAKDFQTEITKLQRYI